MKLAAKLVQVMAAVSHVEKRGRNDFHGYAYAQESDVLAAFRGPLIEHNVLLVPSVIEREVRTVKAGKDQHDEQLVSVVLELTAIDGDSGESLTFRAAGEGQDRGDKAVYKAVTGAVKYALTKLFLVPTGDDPEADSDTDRRNHEGAAASDQRPESGRRAPASRRGKTPTGAAAPSSTSQEPAGKDAPHADQGGNGDTPKEPEKPAGSPSATSAPARTKEVTIQGRKYTTAGADGTQLVDVWDDMKAYNKAKGAGAAEKLLLDTAKVESTLDLTSEQAAVFSGVLKLALGK